MTTAAADVPELASRRAPAAARAGVRAWWGLAGLLAAALLVRVPGMTESIWFDEYYRTFVKMRPENLYALLFNEVHNFLYNGFMYVWIRVFGDADPTIRVPSLVAGVGASLIFWRWVTRRWGSAVGWWVLAWLLLSPVHVWYSTEAKNSMFSVLFATCILVSYDRLLDGPGRGRWVAAAVAAGVLGIFTDFVTLLTLVPVLMVGAWEVARGRGAEGGEARTALRDGPWHRLALVVTLTLAITAPFLLFKLGQEEDLLRDYLKHFDLKQAIMLLCGYLLDGNAILPGRPQREHLAYAAAPLVLGLLAAGMWRVRGVRSGRMVIACFVLPLVFFFVASARIKAVHDDGLHWIYQERNLLILMHPFGLLLMAGAASLPWARLRAPAAGVVLGFGVAGTALMLTAHADRPTVSIPNPDWRGVARIVEEDARSRGEPPVVFSRVWCEPLLHYSSAPIVHRFRPQAAGYKYVLAYLRRYGAGAFYCVDERNASPLRADEKARLARWFDTEATWEVGWVRVHRMRPRPGVTERDGVPDGAASSGGG